ncbi:MAG TPA: GNAT family N-acetyltransferase [Acidimicrobiia bacterium]|nr:GNAT family N-acetyltransferase [Acidimicrobiia bacterium]
MFEIRTITEEDVDLFRSRLSRGFGGDADSDETSAERFAAIFEYDRTLAAFDGDDIIGTGAAFSLGVTVPGGATVPMGGTTVISVQPTHRRRGVLRALMDRHLADVAERGEPIAGLWASESSIYGRFGYGPASYRHKASIEAKAIEFFEDAEKGSVRLIDPDHAGPILKDVYEAVRPTRAGMLTRSQDWWTHRLLSDPTSWRGNKSSLRYATFHEGEEVTGYASYRQKENWEDFLANGEVSVTEVFTTTPRAHTGLWQFLTNIDLFPNLEWWNMPIDDPLVAKVTDSRRVKRTLIDALWIRIMDIPAALSARSYESAGVVTFEVHDATRPDSSGTYRLECRDGIGTCERVGVSADLVFDTSVLGHLYLGGGDAATMAAAGRVEGDLESVRTLHRLFHTDQPPWCPEVF